MGTTIRYFIRLAYNGSNYNGWQRQPNGTTVQEEIERGLGFLLLKGLSITGCGRTDTGVHASEFFAHFDIDQEAMTLSCEQLKYKLNLFLPESIVIHEIFQVNSDVHARFSALSRTYRYQISTGKNPFSNGLSWYYHYPLDVASMNRATEILMTYQDFSCFSKSRTQVKTNNCNITKAVWEQEGSSLVFTITADRFLRNMVRAIVGTMLDVGRGKMTLEEFRKVIEGKNRSNAGVSVPPQGLFLCKVVYPENIREIF